MEILSTHFQEITDYLVFLMDKMGYLGVFIAMFLESTFVPIPSEAIMPPAGMAAAYGKFDLYLVILVGVSGNVCGAIFNYSLAAYFGRPLLLKIGKYFFMSEKTILKIEKFFNKHGAFSTFTGRLIPGIRHYISLPAGVAKMDFKKFCLYTTAGSAIWVSILTYLGFLVGSNQELIKQYTGVAIIICLVLCAVLAVAYMWFVKLTQNNK